MLGLLKWGFILELGICLTMFKLESQLDIIVLLGWLVSLGLDSGKYKYKYNAWIWFRVGLGLGLEFVLRLEIRF